MVEFDKWLYWISTAMQDKGLGIVVLLHVIVLLFPLDRVQLKNSVHIGVRPGFPGFVDMGVLSFLWGVVGGKDS